MRRTAGLVSPPAAAVIEERNERAMFVGEHDIAPESHAFPKADRQAPHWLLHGTPAERPNPIEQNLRDLHIRSDLVRTTMTRALNPTSQCQPWHRRDRAEQRGCSP